MIAFAFKILAWLKVNWLPVFLITCFSLWSIGLNNRAYDRGYKTAENKLKMEIQAAKDEAIEKANQKSKEWEILLTSERDKNRKLNARVKNEIRKNDVAYKCAVPSDGLQFFNQSIGKDNTTK